MAAVAGAESDGARADPGCRPRGGYTRAALPGSRLSNQGAAAEGGDGASASLHMYRPQALGTYELAGFVKR